MASSYEGVTERCWCANVDAPVRTRRWEDGLVVYRTDSGETFRFGVPVFKVLDWLAAGPVPASDLFALLDDEVVEEEPEDLLARLEQAGLASRETAC